MAKGITELNDLLKEKEGFVPIRSERLEEAKQILKTVCGHLGSYQHAWRYQLIGNADQLERAFEEIISSGKTKDEMTQEFKILLKNLIKDPFFRQIGRVKALQKTSQQIQITLEK